MFKVLMNLQKKIITDLKKELEGKAKILRRYSTGVILFQLIKLKPEQNQNYWTLCSAILSGIQKTNDNRGIHLQLEIMPVNKNGLVKVVGKNKISCSILDKLKLEGPISR